MSVDPGVQSSCLWSELKVFPIPGQKLLVGPAREAWGGRACTFIRCILHLNKQHHLWPQVTRLIAALINKASKPVLAWTQDTALAALARLFLQGDPVLASGTSPTCPGLLRPLGLFHDAVNPHIHRSCGVDAFSRSGGQHRQPNCPPGDGTKQGARACQLPPRSR